MCFGKQCLISVHYTVKGAMLSVIVIDQYNMTVMVMKINKDGG